MNAQRTTDASGQAAKSRPLARPGLVKLRLWLLRNLMPTDTAAVLLWAGVVGCAGGLLAVLFRTLNEKLQSLIFGGAGTGLLSGAERILEGEPWWKGALLILALPAAGGLAAGLVMLLGERLTRGAKAPELLEAVTVREGVLRLRPTLVKSAASLLSISCGQSIGREGAIVQLAATVASKFGQWRRESPQRMRLLVGCGVASGIAAAYNAPVAGALFVAEIILGNFAIEVFGPVVFSSVIATLITRQAFAMEPLFGDMHFQLASPWELVPYTVLGLICGAAAPWFRISMRGCKAFFDRWRLPLPLKLMVGGLVVGGIAVFVPAVLGNGYETTHRILGGDTVIKTLASNPMWIALALVLVCKVAATSVTVGSGAVGGVFTPTLFMGAALGAIYGAVVHQWAPHESATAGAYALVGMGALLAGTTHAPLMAMLMLFEMTGDYSIILPLMMCCVLSSFVSRRIRRESIYSEPLQEQGGAWRTAPEALVMTSTRVSEVMTGEAESVRDTAPFAEVVDVFLRSRRNFLYVVGERERFLGSISVHDLKEWLGRPEDMPLIIALDMMDATFPTTTPEERLADVIEKFWLKECERLPVVENSQSRRLVGCVSKRDILGVYGREILDKDFLLTRFSQRTSQGAPSRYVELPPPYTLGEVEVPAEFDGKKLGDMECGATYGLLALIIKRADLPGSENARVASPAEQLRRGDRMIVLGKPEDIERFRKTRDEG